jgi:hypothetical protein
MMIKKNSIPGKFTVIQTTQRAFIIIQLALILINIFIISEILILNDYQSSLLLLLLLISQTSGLALLVGLCYKFFNWYRIQPNAIVLIYAFSLLCLSATLLFLLLSSTNEVILFQDLNNESVKKIESYMRSFVQNSFLDYYSYFYIITFLSLWILSTVLLLDHRNEIGKIKFWVIVAIPLVYFLFFFSGVFNAYISSWILQNPSFNGQVYQYALIIAGPLGGVTLGLTMWFISKNMKNSELARYFNYNAYGISLFFVSIQFYFVSTVTYPPFGVFALSSVGLSTFFMFVGIFSTFLYLRMNKNLTLVLVKRINQYKLFQNIASADLIENVNNLVYNNLDIIDQQDFQSSHPSEESIQEMLNFISEELEKNHKK